MNLPSPASSTNASISEKLRRLIWMTVGSALVFVAFAFAVFQFWSFHTAITERLSAISMVLSSNVKAALEFDEPRQAAKLLESLSAEQDISSVTVLNKEGDFFAGHGNQAPGASAEIQRDPWLKENIEAKTQAFRFQLDAIDHVSPILMYGETIGFLHLHATPKRFYNQLAFSILIILGVTFLSAWFALYWAQRLQRRIVDPIFHLADSMRRVSSEQDFSLRAQKEDDDEIGQLTEGFNRMLAQIEERDRELANANEGLKAAFAEANRAKAHAEEATKSKSMFLANMSHEIRTPMNGVLGMIEILLDSPLQEEQRRQAETALRSGQALVNVISDILDFSKIEAGKLELDPIDFDLRDMTEDVVGLFAEAAQNKGLEISYRISEGVPLWANADSGRLRQILSNLLSNAIKFTERGEVKLNITAQTGADNQSALRFEVQDTGRGISADKQAAVFHEFDQGEVSTARHYGGTGLGLAIVRHLCRLMGGDVGVISTPGVGSTFWFHIKAGVAAEQHPAEFEQDGGGLQGRRVLVVDDNSTNREIMLAHAQGWGMAADAAADGYEALDKLRQAASCGQPYDVVLLDMLMQGISGIELSREIRAAAESLGNIRIVMLTSLNRSATNRNARDAGVDKYLVKPVRKSQMFDAMHVALGLKPDDSHGNINGDEQPDTLVALKVLLVEDNPVNQEVAGTILRRFGCDVAIAEGGIDGVREATTKHWDIILMDCQMPDMDGFEATRRIRAWEAEQAANGTQLPRIPIIALTANAMRGIREECLAAGMDDYVTKPFRQKHLFDTMSRFVAVGSANDLPLEPEPVPAEANSNEVLNPAGLETFRSMDRSGKGLFVGRVIKAYLADSPKQMANAKDALASENHQALRLAAHTMKSASATIGADGLAAICRDIENQAIQGQLDGVDVKLAEASSLLEQVTAELQELQGRESAK